MFKKNTLLALILLFSFMGALQAENYRVVFNDKGAGSFEPGSEKYEAAKASLTPRCLERRSKTMAQKDLITEKDIPLNPAYLDSLTILGAEIRLELKWMNYAVVWCTPEVAALIPNYSFVDTVFSALEKPYKLEMCSPTFIEEVSAEKRILNNLQGTDTSTYGISYAQNFDAGAVNLHANGVFGQGVVVGVLDGEFQAEEFRDYLFKNIHVLEHKDFARNRELTEGEYVPNYHGTAVLSLMAAEVKDSLIGISNRASFYLANTETQAFEQNLETDQFAAAVEYFEAKGVDVISSSLGYLGMEDDEYSIVFDDLDGHTTNLAKYANQAFDFGVFFCTAVGNAGPGIGSLITPADADKSVAVGVMLQNHELRNSSSRGPNASGAIKPDFVTMGEASVFYISDTTFHFSAATSWSTPIMSGMATLLLAADMSMTNAELYTKMKESASRYHTPDVNCGYGNPNTIAIFEDMELSISDLMNITKEENMRCFCRVKANDSVINKTLYVKFSDSDDFEEYILQDYSAKPEDGNFFCMTEIPLSKFNGEPALAYIEVEQESKTTRKPYYPSAFLTLNPDKENVPLGFEDAYLPTGAVGVKGELYSQDNLGINVFPGIVSRSNPTFKISGNAQSITDIAVYNILGENVEYSRANLNEIRLNNIATGCYFINIKTRNGVLTEKVLVK